MGRDRLIQMIALLIALVASVAAGTTLPSLLKQTEEHSLRYTDVSVEGAPPFVAIGTAIGALRGIIVDYLWIKVHWMKQKGLFYEVMADAELITKLQPRFPAVWVFHGHNMAYNISVATHTEQERWEWVNAGIRLVRNQGLRYNPNDLTLHRELAFWFAHKIEGVSDDAHLYYKTEFCREWHYLLGKPPEGYEARIEWIKAIADAPETLEEAIKRTPEIQDLIDRLNAALEPYRGEDSLEFNQRFLRMHGEWIAVKEHSAVAQLMGLRDQWRRERPIFDAFDAIANDPEAADAWEALLNHVRKRVLKDEYNMDPRLMYQFTRDLGPLDWRHGQSHALYWSRRGSLIAESRVLNEDDIYKVINNDRIQLQAMQDLARYGRITFDPFSPELPTRFPERHWIDTIQEEFERVYAKHYDVRGGGGESFIEFLRNFMASAIRELYRSGERARAEEVLERMDRLFGGGQADGPIGADPRWRLPLDVFVRNEIRGEYSFQPHIAPSEVASALRYGMRVGVGQNRPDVWEQSLQFADWVTEYFKGNEYNNFVNKFGRGRMQELLGQLENSVEIAFLQLMTDPRITLEERLGIWRQMEQFNPEVRLRVYDHIRPAIQRQFNRNALSTRYSIDELFPPPAGLEAYREQMARERAAREEALREQRERQTIERN